MKTFKEWIKLKEMIGTGVVMGNNCVKNGKDYQIQGDPCGSRKAMLLTDRKKQKK